MHVSNGSGPLAGLSESEVDAILLAAAAAPSLHNSQPWQFLVTNGAVELHADLRRELPAADPDHRELLMGCGAALLNLRLAIRALGLGADVRLMPDPSKPTLVAVVRPQGTTVSTAADQQLAAAIFRRHTNRRPFLDEIVPEAVVGALRQAARSEQAWFAPVPVAQHSELRDLLSRAHRTQLADPPFVAEWRKWTGRASTSVDGVPTASGGTRPEQQDLWMMRDFCGGQGSPRVGGDFESDPLIAVIGSFNDLPLAQLQAGQAMQRILLTATVEGLSTSFLSQVVEVPQTRRQLRALIGGGLWPQTVLRMGYGPQGPVTRRRSTAGWADRACGME